MRQQPATFQQPATSQQQPQSMSRPSATLEQRVTFKQLTAVLRVIGVERLTLVMDLGTAMIIMLPIRTGINGKSSTKIRKKLTFG